MGKEFKLNEKRIEQSKLKDGKIIEVKHYFEGKDVKEFIRLTIEDIEGGYEGVELIERIKKRAGEL